MAVLLLKLRMGSSKYVRRLRLGGCEQSALHRVCARVRRLDDRRWSGGGGWLRRLRIVLQLLRLLAGVTGEAEAGAAVWMRVRVLLKRSMKPIALRRLLLLVALTGMVIVVMALMMPVASMIAIAAVCVFQVSFAAHKMHFQTTQRRWHFVATRAPQADNSGDDITEQR